MILSCFVSRIISWDKMESNYDDFTLYSHCCNCNYFMGRQLTIMELGDDIARSLGQRTEIVRMIIGLLVIVLAGMSVSIAGPIGFVGLIVPHIVKRYVSKNYLVMLPLTFILVQIYC